MQLLYLLSKWYISPHGLVTALLFLWFLRMERGEGDRQIDCTIWGLYKCLSDSRRRRLCSSKPLRTTENNPKATERRAVSLTAIACVSEQQMRFGELVVSCLTRESTEVPERQEHRAWQRLFLWGQAIQFVLACVSSNVLLSYHNCYSRTTLFIEISVSIGLYNSMRLHPKLA